MYNDRRDNVHLTTYTAACGHKAVLRTTGRVPYNLARQRLAILESEPCKDCKDAQEYGEEIQ